MSLTCDSGLDVGRNFYCTDCLDSRLMSALAAKSYLTRVHRVVLVLAQIVFLQPCLLYLYSFLAMQYSTKY